MKEIWKDIKGFEGFYQVSNMSRVRSLDRFVNSENQWNTYKRQCKGKVLINVLHPPGYYRVDLCGKLYSIHRLVAIAFIPNPNNLPEINHINGIPTDNRIENLEWCTHSENIRHADRTGLRKMPSGKDHCMYGVTGGLHRNSKKVIDKKTGIVYDSIKEAAKATVYDYKYISMMLKNKCRNMTNLTLYDESHRAS